jgi:hypothetical protein
MDIEIPSNYSQYTLEEQALVLEYLNQLNNIQKQAYKIAKEHLGSSFHIVKSNGYIEWLNKKNK